VARIAALLGKQEPDEEAEPRAILVGRLQGECGLKASGRRRCDCTAPQLAGTGSPSPTLTETGLKEPEQGSPEAIYVSAMVGEMMRRVLDDALLDLAKAKGPSYLDTFLERELARYSDLFRERVDDRPETTDALRAWFLVDGQTALREVVARAMTAANRE
jgi:hypothetical protein